VSLDEAAAAIAFLRAGGNALVPQRILGYTTLATTNRCVALASDGVRREHNR
jgi:hypothetical protein